MTTNARHTPPPAAIPASIAVLDGDSSGANKQIKEYEHYFYKTNFQLFIIVCVFSQLAFTALMIIFFFMMIFNDFTFLSLGLYI